MDRTCRSDVVVLRPNNMKSEMISACVTQRDCWQRLLRHDSVFVQRCTVFALHTSDEVPSCLITAPLACSRSSSKSLSHHRGLQRRIDRRRCSPCHAPIRRAGREQKKQQPSVDHRAKNAEECPGSPSWRHTEGKWRRVVQTHDQKQLSSGSGSLAASLNRPRLRVRRDHPEHTLHDHPRRKNGPEL
jgi:uncharacterized protein with PIN domain